MPGFITFIIISVFTPGPNNIFASVSTARIGFRKTMPFMLGVLLGTFIIFVITAYFNLFLYENIRIITNIIGILGGLFIIYLAIQMFLTRTENEKLMIGNDKVFLTALFLNFINAKTIIFGLTVAAYYLQLEFPSSGIIPFSVLMAVLCYISVILWGLFGKVFKDLLTKYRTAYNITMSILLAYSGLIIIIESISSWAS